VPLKTIRPVKADGILGAIWNLNEETVSIRPIGRDEFAVFQGRQDLRACAWNRDAGGDHKQRDILEGWGFHGFDEIEITCGFNHIG
jgi:hypothetical protein